MTSQPTFFKVWVVEGLQAVIDYTPKRVQLSALFRGQVEELMGLVYLSESSLTLPRTVVRGVLGIDNLLAQLVHQWVDQWKSQVPGIVGGIPGVRPVRNVIGAASGVVHQPFAQYPRVMRGLRDGVSHGLVKTTVEFCNVASTLAFALQSALEVSELTQMMMMTGFWQC